MLGTTCGNQRKHTIFYFNERHNPGNLIEKPQFLEVCILHDNLLVTKPSNIVFVLRVFSKAHLLKYGPLTPSIFGFTLIFSHTSRTGEKML